MTRHLAKEKTEKEFDMGKINHNNFYNRYIKALSASTITDL